MKRQAADTRDRSEGERSGVDPSITPSQNALNPVSGSTCGEKIMEMNSTIASATVADSAAAAANSLSKVVYDQGKGVGIKNIPDIYTQSYTSNKVCIPVEEQTDWLHDSFDGEGEASEANSPAMYRRHPVCPMSYMQYIGYESEYYLDRNDSLSSSYDSNSDSLPSSLPSLISCSSRSSSCSAVSPSASIFDQSFCSVSQNTNCKCHIRSVQRQRSRRRRTRQRLYSATHSNTDTLKIKG